MTGKKIIFYLLAAFILGTLILAYLQHNVSKNINSLIRGNQQYLEEYIIGTNLRSLERDMVKVESNISDYVSTGNRHFIKDINNNMAKVDDDLSRLKKHIGSDSTSIELVKRIDSIVQLKLIFGKQVLAALRVNGKTSAETLINTLQGKELMDSIYASAQDLQDVRHGFITQINNKNIQSGEKLQSSNIFLIGLVLLSTAALFWYIISIIQKLSSSKEKLKRAVDVKEKFMANVSHEIRTPLNAILGFTHLLEKEPLTHQAESYVKIIRNSGDNLLSIINDILDLSKIEAGMFRMESAPFNPRTVFHSVYDMFQARSKEKNILLQLNLSDNLPPTLIGDSKRLTQILVNLVANALKFTSQGTISITADAGQRSPNKVVLHLQVSDTGIGIPVDKRSLIFERFHQGDDSVSRHYGGTGLGLSIVKQFVDLLGGTIHVDSTPGQGTVFNIEIPYAFEQTEMESVYNPKKNDANQEALKMVSVLAVEDNLINQKLLSKLFEQWGIVHYTIAGDGEEAIRELQKSSYDLILMDIQMPGMDGYHATSEIRQHMMIDIPIIAMTAHALVGEKQKCLDAGMNDYLSKPIMPDELLSLILKYCNTTTKETTPLFKFINLDYLREISAGNIDFQQSISRDFIQGFTTETNALAKAVESSDHEKISHIAHNLKTTISVMGLGTILNPHLDALEAKCTNEAESREHCTAILQIRSEIIQEVNRFISSL